MSRAATDRRRPTALAVGPTANSPGRRVMLYTSRGDCRVSAAEAVALGLELFAAAAELDPAAGAETHPLILALARRVYVQSELLTACAARRPTPRGRR